MSSAERAKIRIVSGHAPFKTGIPEIDTAPSFTLLRDPIQRVASFCRHALDPKKNHYLWKQGVRDLDTLIDNPVREMRNLQTKLLVNPPGPCTNDFSPEGPPPEKLLERAIDILTNQMKCFGIQERFDISMVHIARTFGWRPPMYLTRNESDRGVLIDFTPVQIEKIVQLNALDIELYDFAKKYFNELVDDADWLGGEMEKFERWQNFARPFLNLQQRIKRR